MVGKVMAWGFEASRERSSFRIFVVDGKVDSFDIIDINSSHKASYYRWEIHKNAFEKAMYLSAKQEPEKFKEIYKALKKSDPEYFEIAKKVLNKIQKEYDFK